MAKRVLLGKEGSNFVLKISKPGDDIIDDTIDPRNLLFNSEIYRAGVIRSNTSFSSISSGAYQTLPSTSDSSGNYYIPAYIITEKGIQHPAAVFDYGFSNFSGFEDFLVNMISGLPTAGGGAFFEFSLASSGTNRNRIKAQYIDMVNTEDPRPGQATGYPYISDRSRSSSDGDVKVLILGIPCQYGKMGLSDAVFGTSTPTISSSGGGGSGGSGSISAPSSPQASLTSRTSVQDTLTLSSNSGTGNSGTINYLTTTSNSAPSLSNVLWTTSTTTTVPRGATRYFWAKQGVYISDAGPTTAGYTSPAYDGTPTQFTFTDETGVPVSTVKTSNTITVAGLDNNDSATVSVTGGTYSKNSGAYTSSNGTAVNGDTFSVRQTSSSSTNTTTDVTLTIGTVSDTYSVSTAVPSDNTPDAFNFTDETGKELSTLDESNEQTITGIDVATSISISGNSAQFRVKPSGGSYGAWTSSSTTLTNGATVQLRMNSSGSYSTQVSTTVTIGTVSDTWRLTTRAQVTASTPNSPTVTQTTNTSGSSQTVDVTSSGGSGTIQVSNNNSTWSANGTDFSHTRGTTVNYYARCVSTDNDISSSASTAKFVPPVVTLGNFSAVNFGESGGTNNYTITSQKAGGNFNTYVTSWGTVSYSISNGGASWLTATITNSSTGAYSLQASSFSTVGGTRSTTVTYTLTTQFGYQVAKTFTVEQSGPSTDTTPNAFTFTDVFNATQGQTYTSTVTITGINTGTTLSFTGTTGADYRINSGSYTTSNQTVNNNDTVTVRITAASSAGVGRTGTVSIGGVSDTFSVVTPPDLVPDQFTFTDVTDAGLTSTSTSTITLSGMTSGFGTTATFSGASQADFRVNSGSYSQSSKTVYNGDSITARVVLVSGATGVDYSTTYNAAITVGGISDTFSVTTEADPGQTTT